jgi:DNA-binding response OmpR family regulator
MEERRTILVVDDDTDLRRMYRVALGLAGYQVVEAGDALDALKHLDRDRPDLVILDIGLPGFSGLVVHEEIASHASTRNIPIVVVTGSTVSLDHLEIPCVLRKPVTPDRLVAAVESHLNGSSLL